MFFEVAEDYKFVTNVRRRAEEGSLRHPEATLPSRGRLLRRLLFYVTIPSSDEACLPYFRSGIKLDQALTPASM